MNLTGTLLIILILTAFRQSLIAQDPNQSELKNNALVILQTKCNICHATVNRRKVFTVSNVESHAADIYKQVYVKRRMPKGAKVTLTKEEETVLLLWLKKQGVVLLK